MKPSVRYQLTGFISESSELMQLLISCLTRSLRTQVNQWYREDVQEDLIEIAL